MILFITIDISMQFCVIYQCYTIAITILILDYANIIKFNLNDYSMLKYEYNVHAKKRGE